MDATTLQNNGTQISPPLGATFYHSHREANRTMRMDTGGLCQYCARKAEQRVEMYSPLWQAGPIMYGECCLPQAEAALRQAAPMQAAPTRTLALANRKPRKLWLTAAVTTGIGFIAIGIERLLQTRLF